MIRRYARGSRLLDLGAAGGELGEALASQFSRRTGIEYDVGRIGQLRARFEHVVIANLETTYALPANQNAIVLADVLEHLRGSQRILAMVREALAPGGHVFISVPNVANFTVRLALLVGIFRYSDRGILDETHMRFYTMRSIREEVEAAGFEIVATRASSVPIRLVLQNRIPELLLNAGERALAYVTAAWKAMFGYQTILVARRRA